MRPLTMKTTGNSQSPRLAEADAASDTSPSKEQPLRCAACGAAITNKTTLLEGKGKTIHTFANPHGVLFQIGCFQKATNIHCQGPPVDTFSWFPGYCWQAAICVKCRLHLGWKFSSTDHFWGLILDRLIQQN